MLEFVYLQTNAGFSTSQFMYLQSLFEDADTDRSGWLEIGECVEVMEKISVIRPLSGKDDLDQFVDLFARMDTDRSASLDFQEFLQLCRVWNTNDEAIDSETDGRSPVRSRRKSLLRQNTAQFVAKLSNHGEEELDDVVQTLRKESVALDLEDALLTHHWALPIAFVRDLRESFEFCDVDGSGKIDREELVLLLESLGALPSTTKQKLVLEACLANPCFNGDLTFSSIVQLIVQFNDALAAEVFVANVPKETDSMAIPVSKLGVALYQGGHYLKRTETDSLLLEASVVDLEIDEATFKKLMGILQRRKLTQWRQTYGFTEKEVKYFFEICSAFREKGSSNDCNVRMDKVMEVLDVLEHAPKSESEKEAVMRALMRVDRQHLGVLSFDELLLLLRHLTNRQKCSKKIEENNAAEALNVDHAVILQFRKVFEDSEGYASEMLGRSELKQLLRHLGLVRTSKEKDLLQQIFQEVGASAAGGHPGNGKYTFAQFLWVLVGLKREGVF